MERAHDPTLILRHLHRDNGCVERRGAGAGRVETDHLEPGERRPSARPEATSLWRHEYRFPEMTYAGLVAGIGFVPFHPFMLYARKGNGQANESIGLNLEEAMRHGCERGL